jgi:hypothetical protein
MTDSLSFEEMAEMARLQTEALNRGERIFEFLGRFWVLGDDGKLDYSYPRPKGQTHEAIANMRKLLPLMVGLFQQPHIQQSLIVQEQMVNWDVINDMERQCGLTLTPCPASIATQRRGLSGEKM